MALSYYFNEPFFPLGTFDRLFDEAFASRAGNGQVQPQDQANTGRTRLLRPRYVRSPWSSLASFDAYELLRIDVHEDAEKNVVTATFELPGLKKDDVAIDVHNNLLTVSGESKAETERKEDGYAVRERRYGKFSRSLPLPQGIQVS